MTTLRESSGSDPFRAPYSVSVRRGRRSGLLGIAIGLGLAASIALAGCSLIPSPGGGSGGSDGSGQSGSSSDGSGTSTNPGTDAGITGYEGKPATFPGEVPIVDGDIPFGIDLGTGWTVVVKVADFASAYTAASDKLSSAGFTTEQTGTTTEGSFGVFTTDKYTVEVTAAKSADYGPSVTYVVVLKG
jgi:hypothetical protein